mgnify:CR=1 FL=1
MEQYLQTILLIIIGIPAFVLALFLLIAAITAVITPCVLGEIASDLRAIRERDPAAEGFIAVMAGQLP